MIFNAWAVTGNFGTRQDTLQLRHHQRFTLCLGILGFHHLSAHGIPWAMAMVIHCDSSCAVEVKNSRLLRNKEYQNIPKSCPPFSRSRVLMQNLSPTHASKQFPTNEMLQMSAEMCRKPRRESISFSLGDDPTGNHGKSKMIKMINMITRSRDNTHVRRKCRRRFFMSRVCRAGAEEFAA